MKRIVTVWLDSTSDAEECRWIVDTDIPGGGESDTIRTFAADAAGEAAARQFAAEYAAKHGLDVA